MSKQHIADLITTAINQLQEAGEWSVPAPAIHVEETKNKQYGDFASNIALILAKPLERKPREIAEKIISVLPKSTQVTKVEIAGPGFINFFLTQQALSSTIETILKEGNQYGHAQIGKGKKILIEFLSANPNGPLHVGHGRHAAYGAVVADLLETIGYDVHREYYVNDAGRQMDILTVSAWLRYLEIAGEKIIFPANAYKGQYVVAVAEQLFQEFQNKFYHPLEDIYSDLPLDEGFGGDKEIYIDALIQRVKHLLKEEQYQIIFNYVLSKILADIQNDLAEFGIHYQSWFSEKQFVSGEAVNQNINELRQKDLLYEKEGATWFRATHFGDEKDRVIQRSNGIRTYFANDFAYHVNKFERGFDYAIDIFGSDHHGYIPRMKAALQARDIPKEKLTCLLVQFVTLYRGKNQVQMSTRSGSFVTLRELRAEVGNDAARFFYVMRKCEQHIDFDLELAKSKSNENPVYYIQYAHARICSVFRQAEEKNIIYDEKMGLNHLNLLKEPQELTLLATLAKYPDVIISAAENYEPHILTNYLRDLATDFHSYYNSHSFLVDDQNLCQARLVLIKAARQVIQNGLKLIGVSSPEKM